MRNILAQHDFLDEKDALHGIWDMGYVPLDNLMKLLHCKPNENYGNAEPPQGFATVKPDDLHSAGLTVYDKESFFEVKPQPAPTDFKPPDWWREVHYVNDERTRLITFPNGGDEQPRLMVYGAGPEIKSEQTLQTICMGLRRPDTQTEPGYLWIAEEPFIRLELCHAKDASIACVNRDCPNGEGCDLFDIESRDPHCKTVCACKPER